MTRNNITRWLLNNKRSLIVGFLLGAFIAPFLAIFGLVNNFIGHLRPLLIGPMDLIGKLIPNVQIRPNTFSCPIYKWILMLGFNGICYAILVGIIKSIMTCMSSKHSDDSIEPNIGAKSLFLTGDKIIFFDSLFIGFGVAFVIVMIVAGIHQIFYNLFISSLKFSKNPFPLLYQLVIIISYVLSYFTLGLIVKILWRPQYPSISLTIPVIYPSLLFLFLLGSGSDSSPGELTSLRIFYMLSPLAYIISLLGVTTLVKKFVIFFKRAFLPIFVFS